MLLSCTHYDKNIRSTDISIATATCACCMLLWSAPALAGVVIVNHDEWPLSSSGVNGADFGVNIANYFAGGPGGNFLIYSPGFGLNDSALISAISAAGHTVTVDTGVTFDLPTLSGYTGIFLGGYIGDFDAGVLTNYVNNGGNVYLAGGTGALPNEDSVWDPFLNNFGFEFGPSYNTTYGVYPILGSHPIFTGIPELFYYWGNTVILTGSNPHARLIEVEPTSGAGLIGI